MKKSLTVLIFLLMVLPIISAVEFDMKTEFSQGETLMARISGNFIEPILKENIFFYRGHVRISMDSYVAKINDEFYIYASLIGKTQNNYSIVLENTEYYIQGGQISEEDITKDFSITNATADFSIAPGFIATKDNFFIEVQNLQDTQITINININKTSEQGFFSFLSEDETGNLVTIKAGEIKKINFELSNITSPVLQTIELSTDNLKYEIPVNIFTEETLPEQKQKSFRFDPPELNISFSTNSNTTRVVYLYNTGEEKLENISLSVSDSLKEYVLFSTQEIEELNANSSIKIELYFSSDNEEKTIKGQIKAHESDLYTYLAASLNFLEAYTPTNGDEIKTCAEINGTICSKNEKCEGETTYAKDGVCCLGTCKKIEKSSAGKIIGWILVVAVVVFLIWFFKKKYRGAKRDLSLFKTNKPRFSSHENKIQKTERSLSRPPVRKTERQVIKPVEKQAPRTIIKEVEKPVVKIVEKKVFVEKPKAKILKYIGSTNTKTYHKNSCRLSKLIKDKYKVSNNDINFFKKQRYKPCKVCLKEEK